MRAAREGAVEPAERATHGVLVAGLDRLEQRQGRQREALDNASRRLEDLQQALRLEQGTLARHMWALTLALSLTTLLALGGVLLNVLSRGPI